MNETAINVDEIVNQLVDEEFLINMDNTVEKITKDSECVQSLVLNINQIDLEKAVKMESLEDDEQTNLFTKFLSVATNFASENFTDRLNNVPKVIQSIADLLRQMRQEVKEYAEIANQCEELVQMFNKLVTDTQHNMGMMLPYLSGAKDHLCLLTNVFESNEKALTTIDPNEIKIAIDGLAQGMKEMKDLSHTSGQESRQLSERITTLKTKVHKQHGTVHGRIHLSKILSFLGPLAGAGIVARTVGALVALKEFGGAGMLIIGGVTLNPIAAIICGALLGGTLIVTIAGLVYRFWTRHQYKALEFLESICTGLMELSKTNMFLLDYLNRTEEAANSIGTQLEQIQNSLTSERYRKHNAKLCKKASETIEEAVQVIDKVRNIDMSPWLVPQQPPLFAIHNLVLAIGKPQAL